MTDRSPPDPLDRLTRALAEAVTSLQAAPPDVHRDRLVGLGRGALSQFRTVAGPLAWRESAAPISDAGTPLHDLREPVTVIAGWAPPHPLHHGCPPARGATPHASREGPAAGYSARKRPHHRARARASECCEGLPRTPQESSRRAGRPHSYRRASMGSSRAAFCAG
jgi:hypothetical protein